MSSVTTINDLIDFIKKYRPTEYMSSEDWQKILTKSCPGWKSLVKDPNNWPLIEKVRPQAEYHSLCTALVKAAGDGLAIRWFDSSVEEQRIASREWLEDISTNLTPKIWNGLSDEAKEYVIHYTFDTFIGELLGTYRYLARSIEYFAYKFRHSSTIPSIILPPLPAIGCVPSKEILQLRSVIQRAGDKEFLKVVDDMIKERKEACEKSCFQVSRTPYTPTGDERELIARAMEKFIANGYAPSALPEIYLSFETPPLFVAYPELEGEGIEERGYRQREPRIPRNRERRRPETISIEELLGCYLPDSQIILLYQRGLKWCAEKHNFDEELLRGIVLIHEIGHWITHLLPKPGAPSWPTELYKLTSKEVHEGWAQLITWWVVDEIGGEIKQVFKELNRHQSPPYRIFKKFKNNSVNLVINSLEMLRQLRRPAGISEWERLIK